MPLNDEVHQRVLEESKRFRERLPELLAKYDGRWIIFLRDEVQGDFDDEEAAYTAAVRRFGVRGGFVIARVDEDADKPLVIPSLFF
jgi:hypothetical protein